MIDSKPSTTTITSFTIFLIISIVIIGMLSIQIIQEPEPAWYIYLTLIFICPVTVFVFIKIFFNYKVIHFGNNRISVDYRVRKKHRDYPLEEVTRWHESIVKTGKNSTFKEIEIQFEDGSKLNLGHKEYSNYSEVYSYLLKKLKNKKAELG